MNEKLFVLNSQKKNTSHILHLLLTIFTGGLWVIVWLIVASSNSSHNKKLDSQINQIMQYKTQGLSDNETYQQIKVDKANSDVLEGRVIFVVIVLVVAYLYFR